MSPLLPVTQTFELSLGDGVIRCCKKCLIGVAIGFCLQMIFDALIIAGQTIAMGMGLGLATMIDPQRGISVPVISQFFVILGLLIFLALGGHLATLRLIADSFEILPLGQPLGERRRLGRVAALGQPDVRGRAAHRAAGGDGAADRQHRVRCHEPRRADAELVRGRLAGGPFDRFPAAARQHRPLEHACSPSFSTATLDDARRRCCAA